MKHKLMILTWIPVLALMVIIFRFSASTGDESSGLSLELTKDIVLAVTDITNVEIDSEKTNRLIELIHTPIRKLGHLAEYAALGFALCLPFYFYHNKRKKELVVFSEGFLMIYACIDEFHQLFVPERTGRVLDVFIDSIGGAIGILAFYIMYKVITTLKSR
ncbi:MAG: VanZ family protein [Anaerocolumna sp.]